ncbi:MAG: glucose 1-dehydrogenase [Pseudomonadota bacterium]
MRLENKVAIITGSGSGIGRATALLFANEAASIVVADVEETGGNETVRLIKESGGNAIFAKTNVSRAEDAAKSVESAVKTYGKVDILVNAAGTLGKIIEIVNLSEEEWDKIINVDLKGIFLMSKYAIPKIKEAGGGAIVNISSICGYWVGCAKLGAYCAAKAGVVGLTKAMAIECAPYRIKVNAIGPGDVDTPMHWMYTPKRSEMDIKRKRRHPLGEVGKPEELANAILFLSDPKTGFITGAAVPVDGGFTILGDIT